MASFVHLHTHSHYSLLTALPKIEELVEAAVKDGMPALALTDNGNLYGAIEFYKECKKKGIKPIIGVDAYLAARTRHDREPKIDNKRTRLILLAENIEGYKNLLKLVTKANLEGFYYKPRMDKELLEAHREGLIAILPGWSSEVSEAIKGRDLEGAEKIAQWYLTTFGKGNVFFEVTHQPDIDGHDERMEAIIALGKKMGIPLVGGHDVYYLKPEDRRPRETMVRIQTGATFAEREDDDKADFSFISQKDAEKFFKKIPEALSNTIAIADRVNLELQLGSWVFPNPPMASTRSYEEELTHVAYEGIKKRGLEDTPELRERIEYELKVIQGKGFSPYFLVVADLLRFARENGILTTTRGSAAGSVVSYLTGITNVNPIEYKLPFERFLNPERPKAPDIDMDFADDRRDEVLQYAKRTYGEDKVAQIGTFGTMMARAAVRDVARALGHPYAVGDQIAKLIPFGSQGFPMTLEHALEIIPELPALIKKDKDAKEVIELARKIEGCARHISIHAAGVVISPKPLTEFVPLQLDPKGGKIITQYDMHSVEDAGLLKFDFLGIKNLSILSNAVRLAKKMHGVDIQIENIPLNDPKTFQMLTRGETLGTFQLNGDGMTRFLMELKPSSIHDINAMVALYRPGPMESIPSYIERKHNPKLVKYLDPRMEEILNQSYGVVTYQDDVLLIAVKLAGYSWLEADSLRKAMGKKIPAEMQAQKEKLMKGAIEHGMTPQKADQLWKLIEPFAAYGFNKAHAACYGKVAYQTAYMKANYPAEYMAAVLTADAGDVEKIYEEIEECKRLGIAVLPPSVNESFGAFTVIRDGEKASIRFGLHSIKNFGEGVADVIIEERKTNGRYGSLENFLERANDKNLNRKSLEALIKCGALDEFGDRGTFLKNIEKLLTYHKESSSLAQNQDSLFGGLVGISATSLSLEQGEAVPMDEQLKWEKELLGIYVSGHPLDRFKEKLARRPKDIKGLKSEFREGATALLAGIVEESKEILTKKGDKMAFLRIADFGDNMEVVVFPKVLAEYKKFIELEKCIAIKGRLSGRNGTQSMIAEAVKEL